MSRLKILTYSFNSTEVMTRYYGMLQRIYQCLITIKITVLIVVAS